MTIPTWVPEPGEMERHIAMWDSLEGSDTGFPDSPLPGHHRILKNVVGFQQPTDGTISPVGNQSPPAIDTAAGFGVTFIQCRAGNGPPMHTHDTNETFIGVEGRWKVEWESVDGKGMVEFGPKDTVSVPPGVIRRFECVAVPDGQEFAVLLGVIGGDAPRTEPAPEAIEELRAAGLDWGTS